MNLAKLLNKALPAHEPLASGIWGTILFKPDLGSRQEFIVGAVAALNGDHTLYVQWIPSFAKLSKFYGDMSAHDISTLIEGCGRAMRSSFDSTLNSAISGTPHLRIEVCGYFAADNVESELAVLLKRHASAVWSEINQRDDPMNDDWAYSEMIKALTNINVRPSIIVPHRHINVGPRKISVAFDNGQSFAAVTSARYANYSTVERHILLAHKDVTAANKLKKRLGDPAIFVVLHKATSPDEIAIRQKSLELLYEIKDSGIRPFSSDDPSELATAVEQWATEQ